MVVHTTTDAVLKIPAINGPIVNVGNIKGAYKVLNFYIHVNNDAYQNSGKIQTQNAAISFYPALAILTEEAVNDITSANYGVKPLGDISFYYLIRGGNITEASVIKLWFSVKSPNKRAVWSEPMIHNISMKGKIMPQPYEIVY